MLQNKSDDQQIQNSYLSSIFHKNNQPTIHSNQNLSSIRRKKQGIQRTKINFCFVDNINQQSIQRIKRKNSHSNHRNFRKIQHYSLQSKNTPYQNIKKQKLLFRDKRDKVSTLFQKIPAKLEETKDNFLIVKQALSNTKRERLLSEASSQRIKIDISDICQQDAVSPSKQEKVQNDKNKCIKNTLNYYKNKNVIKHHIQNNRHSRNNTSIKKELGLKLLNLSQTKNSLKIQLQEKSKCLYTSKRRILKKKKKVQERSILTENVRASLINSTHSDKPTIQAINTLDGVLNSFKVDMKFKQIKRPKTAQKLFKSDNQSPNVKKRKYISSKLLQMSGWQNESNIFQRDIFFS